MQQLIQPYKRTSKSCNSK